MNVTHPDHYTQTGMECIEAIKGMLGVTGFQDYMRGNIIKYLWRYRDKNGIEDLEKASVYLERLISEVRENEDQRD